MEQRKTDYLKQHIWNIIQCFLGLGCLVLDWLVYHRNTRSIPAPPAGESMTPHYSMPWYLWAGIAALSFSVIIPAVIGMIRKRRTKPSKLNIHSADYAASDGSGSSYDVAECLRKLIAGDSLILKIENHNFVVDGSNFVPEDPKPGEVKRLRIVYSYDHSRYNTIVRPEHSLLVLPEDSYLKNCAYSAEVPLWSGYESEDAWRNSIAEQNRLVTLGHSVDGVFNPIQVEGFRLAMELQQFIVSVGPPPVLDQTVEVADAIIDISEREGKWQLRLRSGFELRFSERVKTLVHQFGEQGLEDQSLNRLLRGDLVSEQVVMVPNNIRLMCIKLDAQKG